MCPDFPQTSGGATAAQVWAYGTKALTDKAGFTISGTKQTLDVLNDVASTDILNSATKLDGDRINSTPAYNTVVEASVVMDGTEKTLVEKTNGKMGLLEGFVDLTSMADTRSITIRQYMKVKTGGGYIKYAEVVYTGTQEPALLWVATKSAKTSIKVTAEQTVEGVGYCTLDTQFTQRAEA